MKNPQIPQRLPVYDTELENAVLGAILLERHAFATANSYLHQEVFYSERNQLIYKAAVSLFDKSEPIDLLTIATELRASGDLEKVGGAYEVTKITNNVVSSANIEAHCKVLIEYYLKRESVKIGSDLVHEGYTKEIDVFDSYGKADSLMVNTLERAFKGVAKDTGYYVTKVYDEYTEVKHTGVLGISTGIKKFDAILCGLVAPDLIIVAARPGQGKSALAFSLMRNISVDQKVPGVIFNFEMNGTQVVRRLASQVSSVPHEGIRRGTLTSQEEVLFFNACDFIANCPIYIEDDSSMTVRDIRTKSIILKRKHGVKYIIVDYLQLIPSVNEKGKNREQVVSEISRGLKSLAKELDVPIIALSQLSRAVEARSDKIPMLSDLRESGAIEQDADSVLFLMRPAYYNMVSEQMIGGTEYDSAGLVIGIIAKNRHGETKNFAMGFEGPTMMMGNHFNDTRRILNEYDVSISRPQQAIPNNVNEISETDDWGDQPF
jgi:replicative DNA helicase